MPRHRTELSTNNEYYISKERYQELRYRCLQYKQWIDRKEKLLTYIASPSSSRIIPARGSAKSDPVTRLVVQISILDDKIRAVERCAECTDDVLYSYILRGVTEGLSYDCLRTKYGIPCCKNEYYKLYHKFFWLLDKEDME